jgi:hypothetical protein
MIAYGGCPMEHGATARGQGVPNQPAGGGRWAEIAKKMLFRGNEPKTLLKIKNLAFSGPQNELLFECKKNQSKQRIWQKSTCGRRALDCHAVILSAAERSEESRSGLFRRKTAGRGASRSLPGVLMGLRPTQGDENRPCCHPRVSGGPGQSTSSWIPAFAGMTGIG